MPHAVDPVSLSTSAELGHTMAQRLCDEVAHARQGLRRTLLMKVDRQRLYEELAQQVQDATDDALRLGMDLAAGEGWCVGFVETLASEDPTLLDRPLTHGLPELWSRRTRPSLPHQHAWTVRRQNALDHALETLADGCGTARRSVQALLEMGADPMAQAREDETPLWHTALVREAQADVERHVDLLLAQALGIRSGEGLARLNRALDATVVDLGAVLEQDQQAWAGAKPVDEAETPLSDAWTMVFQEMMETAQRIAVDEADHVRPVG